MGIGTIIVLILSFAFAFFLLALFFDLFKTVRNKKDKIRRVK